MNPDIFTVSFFGHRELRRFNEIEARIYEIAARLIWKMNMVEFLVGRDGDFDQLVSSTVRIAKRNEWSKNSWLILVLPYMRREYKENKKEFESYYDDIYFEPDERVYPKAAITMRNRWMVDQSNLCVFCVERDHGGAWQTMQYAKRKSKLIVNIWDEKDHEELLSRLDKYGKQLNFHRIYALPRV